ncbi:MAG: ribosome-binding factor RbfA [Rhodobacteraceae bacterium HLUCCA08]|nr:MAG: ribosome-binding factor RbfA [Rhodobacteraceae bacterium HLUCCA08]
MGAMAKNRPSSGGAPSQRQLRVGELIRRTLSDALMRGDVHDPDLAAMSITVGEVRVSPDLRVATAYVLPLGGREPELAVAALARNVGELRRIVGRAVKLKATPELRFRVDDTYDRIDRTRAMFADAKVRQDLDE